MKGLPLTRYSNIKSDSSSKKKDLHLQCGGSNNLFDIYLATVRADYHTVEQSDENEPVRVPSQPQSLELETGGDQWYAGLALCYYLIQNPHLVRGKRCLELGSGLGLVGLTAARLGARRVVLTDLELQLDVLKYNVGLNLRIWNESSTEQMFFSSTDNMYVNNTTEAYLSQSLYGQNRECVCECDVVAHEFGDLHSCLHLVNMYDIEVILGSDIGYDVGLLDKLSDTLSTLVRAPSFSQALLAEEMRWKDVYAWYQESIVEKCIGVVHVPTNIDDTTVAIDECVVSNSNNNICLREENISFKDREDVDVVVDNSLKLFKCQILSEEKEVNSRKSANKDSNLRVNLKTTNISTITFPITSTFPMKEIAKNIFISKEQSQVPTSCLKSHSMIKLLVLESQCSQQSPC